MNALEAAHITPYSKCQSDELPNGLLLRADIHTLFDQDLIGIDPKTLNVALSPCLRNTSYEELHERELLKLANEFARPSQAHLSKRWISFQDNCNLNLQFPLDEPMQIGLIEQIVKLRVKQDSEKAAAKRKKRK